MRVEMDPVDRRVDPEEVMMDTMDGGKLGGTKKIVIDEALEVDPGDGDHSAETAVEVTTMMKMTVMETDHEELVRDEAGVGLADVARGNSAPSSGNCP